MRAINVLGADFLSKAQAKLTIDYSRSNNKRILALNFN